MATIGLVSAKGAPGVTTLTIGLCLAWAGAVPGRSALALDMDRVGGDFAPGVLAGALPEDRGMLRLATARGLHPVDAVRASTLHLRPDGSAGIVPGVPDSARGAALELAWDTVARAVPELEAQGTDLLVDCGRVDPGGAVPSWLAECDLAVLVVRPTLVAVNAAHRFVAAWRSAASDPSRHAGVGPLAGSELQAVVVTSTSTYAATEVAEALGLPLLASVPFDPQSARVHSDGAPAGRGFERRGYARGTRGLAERIAGVLDLRSAIPVQGTAGVAS